MKLFSDERRMEAEAILLSVGVDLSKLRCDDKTVRELLDEQVIQGNDSAARFLSMTDLGAGSI